jgi:hypothetical protein
MFDRQELQHLVGLGAERAFLLGDAGAAEPGVPQAFARLPGGTIIRFSRQVIEENSCAIWKVRRGPWRNSSCGVRPVISSPSMMTVPEVGGRTPAITLKSVVFPAPLGPISPVMEPVSISSGTRRRRHESRRNACGCRELRS